MDKTTFLIGCSCPTKMLYHRQHLPTRAQDDQYVNELGEYGQIIHELARMQHPSGRMARGLTLRDIIAQGGTYFEVPLQSDSAQARADIVSYVDGVLTLNEVKSSTSRSKKHLQDIAFQAAVLEEELETLGVNLAESPRYVLTLVDKEHVMQPHEVWSQWSVNGVQVTYHGNPAVLRATTLLTAQDVTDEVQARLSEIRSERARLEQFLQQPTAPQLKTACKDCEYTVAPDGGGESGFARCWAGRDRHDVQPHILDLYEIGNVGGRRRDIVVELTQTLGAEGASALRVSQQDYRSSNNDRQERQLRAARLGHALQEDELAECLRSHVFPLHFIDFETVSMGVPCHVGARPYEVTPVQWSIHTLHGDGRLEHREWLHAGTHHPASEFLSTLMDALRTDGTIYIYSSYERTSVNSVKRVLERTGELTSEHERWITWFADKENPRIVDLLLLCRNYYIHPDNKGSASIKDVLPPIWREDAAVRALFPEYVRIEEGIPIDPYKTLSDVANGTAAMSAYRELNFGTQSRPELRRALLDYCRLDTAAMVMLWKHWTR